MANDEHLPQLVDRFPTGTSYSPGTTAYTGGPAPPTTVWPEDNDADPEQPFDWRRWAYLLWRRKWWIAAVTVLGTALSVVIARRQEPVYGAQAMVWVEAPERGGPIEITNMFSTAGWIHLMTSYAVLDAAVHDLKLYLRPEHEADRPLLEDFELTDSRATGTYHFVVRLNNTYALLDEEGHELETAQPGDSMGDSLGFRWLPPEERLLPGKEFVFKVRLPRNVADGLRGNLDVGIAEGGNFIHLAYSGGDRYFVANTLNGILERFVSVAAELKRKKLTNLVGTLEEQLELASDRLRRAESRLQTFRVSSITLPAAAQGKPGTGDGGPGGPVFDRFLSVSLERDAIQTDREELTEIVRALEETGELDVMRLEIVPSVRTSSAILAALQELRQKELDHRTLLYRYRDQHADVQRAASEVNALRRQTIPHLVRQLMQALAQREAQLADQIEVQTATLQRIPPRELGEQRLRREVALAENLYNSLQVRYKEAQVAEASSQPNVRVLERASPPQWPTKNKARQLALFGFAVSLGIGVAGVIVHDRFVDRRVQYPEQVVSDLGLPILGVVPNLRALTARASDGDVASPHVQSVVESFRALRTQLTHGLGIQYPAVIAITSPAMGDGKSLVTSNLALAFADPARPTLLIDGDLRRGSLHRTFGGRREPGLTDYLRGDAEPVLIVKATETEGLFFTPRGSYSEEVPELLDGEGLPALLAQLRQSFKVILIDTPPLAAGVDAVLIGAHADAVLAVLRSGRTDLDLARAKLESYAQMLGVPIVGAILNDVQAEGPYRYHTYGYEIEVEELT